MKHHLFTLRMLALAAAALAACGETSTDPHPTASSFDLIQTKVFARSCATSGCHTAGSQMAQQSGLVLDPGVAHANLVGVAATNEAARADGLLRVKAGSPEKSLLYVKITDPEHHAGYGSLMPLGADPLSSGQIEFIRQWIAAGAPKTGVVADASLLDDSHGNHGPFTPLAPPAPGAGYQITTGLFEVAPKFERELFMYRSLGNTDTIYINRIETKMRPGSHHLVLYTFPPGTPRSVIPPLDVIRDIRNPDNTLNQPNMQAMAFHQFAAGAMSPYESYDFPPGVALPAGPDLRIDINSHYVNTTSQPRPGEAFVNFYTVDRSQVRHMARPLFLNHTDFLLPPGKRTTVRRTQLMNARRTIFLLTSHMHKRGERFVIKIHGGPRDGEVVYESTDWAHPPVKVFNDNPIVLEANQGLTWETTYFNETSRPIEFGLTSEDEMNILIAYYY